MTFCICNFPLWSYFWNRFVKIYNYKRSLCACNNSLISLAIITKLKVSLCSVFSHLSIHSFGLSCLSTGDRAESSEGEAHEPEDGQQVGERRGVYRRDAERGAGLLHARRPLQSPALTSV